MGLESPQQQHKPLLWIGSFCGAIALHLGVFWLGRFLWLQQLSTKASSSAEDYIAIEFLVTPDSPDPVASSPSPSQESPPSTAVPSQPTNPTEDSGSSSSSLSNPPQFPNPTSPLSSPSPQSPLPSPEPSPQNSPPTPVATPIPTPILPSPQVTPPTPTPTLTPTPTPTPIPSPTSPPSPTIPQPSPSPSAPSLTNTPQPSPTTIQPPVAPSNPPIAANPEPSPPASVTGLEVSLGSLQLTDTRKDIPDELAIATQQRQQLPASNYLDPLGIDLQQDLELQVVVLIDNQGQAEVLPDFTEVKKGEIPAQTATSLTQKILQQWVFQPTMMAGQPVTQVYYLTLTIRPIFNN